MGTHSGTRGHMAVRTAIVGAMALAAWTSSAEAQGRYSWQHWIGPNSRSVSLVGDVWADSVWYLFGREGTASQVYNPGTNSWASLPTPPS